MYILHMYSYIYIYIAVYIYIYICIELKLFNIYNQIHTCIYKHTYTNKNTHTPIKKITKVQSHTKERYKNTLKEQKKYICICIGRQKYLYTCI